MACVLLVGSHPDMTHYVAALLRSEGWDIEAVVGPEAGLAAIDRLPEVDVLVIGGPAAFAARTELESRLRDRHPYAPVVFPRSPDTIARQLVETLGGEEN